MANAFVFDVHDRIQYLPGSTEARKVIVSTALRYLENLRQDAENDAALLRELAAAYEKIGDVQGNPGSSNLGDSQGALTSYRRAESILTPLAAKGDGAAKFSLTSTTYKLGSLQHVLGDPAGKKQLEHAQKMARELVAQQGNDLRVLGLAGNINSDLTRLASDARDAAGARQTALEATAIAQRMVGLQPSSQESRDFLALSQNSLASAYRASGDLELSVQTYRESLKVRERLAQDFPENMNYRRLLLITYGHLGDALGPPEANGLGRLDESVQAFEKAAALAESISQRDPADRKSLFDLVAAHMRTADSLLVEPDGAREALPHLTKAELILSRLVKEDPSNQRYRYYALALDNAMGKALAALGRNAPAVRRLERVRSAAHTFRGGPNEALAQSAWIFASLRLGDMKAKSGDPVALSMADEIAAALSQASPGVITNRWNQASLYGRLGTLYTRIGQVKAATVWLEKSAEVWREMTVPAVLEAERRKALAAVEQELNRR
ncbi:MAG TPA: tetratricopeptide repeat protein [Bryobacteraceae bacterium]|nr:tetratricopeptide repeat protein [Bryobacteraceae bacterium]